MKRLFIIVFALLSFSAKAEDYSIGSFLISANPDDFFKVEDVSYSNDSFTGRSLTFYVPITEAELVAPVSIHFSKQATVGLPYQSAGVYLDTIVLDTGARIIFNGVGHNLSNITPWTPRSFIFVNPYASSEESYGEISVDSSYSVSYAQQSFVAISFNVFTPVPEPSSAALMAAFALCAAGIRAYGVKLASKCLPTT